MNVGLLRNEKALDKNPIDGFQGKVQFQLHDLVEALADAEDLIFCTPRSEPIGDI